MGSDGPSYICTVILAKMRYGFSKEKMLRLGVSHAGFCRESLSRWPRAPGHRWGLPENLVPDTLLLWLTTPFSVTILDDKWFSSRNKQDIREQTWTYESSIPA